MISTKANRAMQKIRNFFEKELMPLAETLKESGISFLALGPDHDADTYYIDRHKATISRGDFEIEGGNCADDLERALVDLWTSQGYPQLTTLAPALCELAKICHSVEIEQEQKGDVSPAMYVLF